jgi:hypothetical protein
MSYIQQVGNIQQMCYGKLANTWLSLADLMKQVKVLSINSTRSEYPICIYIRSILLSSFYQVMC